MKAKDRKADLLAAAVRLAEREGLANLRRDAIAVEAGVAFSLVTLRLGTMAQVKRAVMRDAIRNERLALVGQGLAMRDPHALKAPAELKDRAVQWIAASAGR